MKYYFQKDAEIAYPLSVHIEEMKAGNIKEMQVFEAVRQDIPGIFYCHGYGEFSETGMCGKSCDLYEPRNGKSGICKHHDFIYEPVKSKILRL